MKGVSFVMDEKNRRKAVIIEIKTLEKHQEEIEDLLDGIVAESRKDEEKISLDAVVASLKQSGKVK